MVYIPEHEMWYCIECQEKELIWYPSHESEEDRWQHDYINMYYEEKFHQSTLGTLFLNRALVLDERLLD